MTIGVAIVTCLHRVRRIHKAAQTPLPCETSITRAWAVATARRPWAGLTVCVYMDVHASPVRCRVLLYTLFYLLMMPAARLVCQRLSSDFPYFQTPLANFLLSRPNSVEYGNSKTTTLLPSAKCTLFQGRTGCSGRPSGWHNIITCQHLVAIYVWSSLCGIISVWLSPNYCSSSGDIHSMFLYCYASTSLVILSSQNFAVA